MDTLMTDQTTELRARFRDIVTSEDALREVGGQPGQRALDKVVRTIDDHSRRFIAAAPFVFIASSGAGGVLDVSPKGDPAGFVTVLDERTLAIPDRLGNRRFDTFSNVLVNPQIGLIFVVPGVAWTLRVSGEAIITRDQDLRASLAFRGKPPDHVLVVGVTHVLAHCPKCMIRSGLWTPDAWPDTTDVPTLAEALIAHAKLAEPLGDVETMLEHDSRERLY